MVVQNIVQKYEKNNGSFVLEELKNGSYDYDLVDIYSKLSMHDKLKEDLADNAVKKNRVKI